MWHEMYDKNRRRIVRQRDFLTVALLDIRAERYRQDELWGPSDGRPVPSLKVLVEEVGEVAAAMQGEGDLREELIHAAALAVAMVEGIDRGDIPNG